MSAVAEKITLPREDLYRAHINLEFERAQKPEDGTLGVLRGYFVTWAERAEIDSLFEGHFLEQFDRGAFTKTFKENGDGMRMLVDHGMDPQQGRRPIAGKFTNLSENATGATYEAPLLDTEFNRELLPGLEAGLYGASMRFKIIRAEENLDPGRTKDNPDGIPTRNIKEALVREVSVTAFPVYKNTSADVSARSITDEMTIARVTRDEAAREAIRAMLVNPPTCAARSEEEPPAETPAETEGERTDDPPEPKPAETEPVERPDEHPAEAPSEQPPDEPTPAADEAVEEANDERSEEQLPPDEDDQTSDRAAQDEHPVRKIITATPARATSPRQRRLPGGPERSTTLRPTQGQHKLP